MLGGFEVVRQLSEGASAEVFLARPEQTQERVIVEVIRPELYLHDELRHRFLDEAQLRKALEHPNVARRVQEGTARDGRPFFVSEALGESLADWLRARGPLEVRALVELIVPLCEALHYLHARGLVHGNLKPQAVHLGPEGAVLRQPKLVDYGLALFRPGRSLPRPPGRVLVEAEYLAPERIRGQRGTAASDLYALGVLMYEALTGAPPFCGDAVDVRHQHLTALPSPLPAHCAPVAKVVERCLSKLPEARFASALAVRDALLGELEGTLPLPPPSFAEPAPAFEAGEQVGRYTLVEPIGEGAMGRVFLARHSRLGRIVALKLLKPELTLNAEQVERFVREARAVNRIGNEHIVEIFDLVDEQLAQGGRRIYCVMELLRGWTVGELMARGELPLARGLRLLLQVADALEAAHRAGVIHRDVKPDNLFVTQRDGADFVKVVDFGVAKLRELEERLPSGEWEAPRALALTSSGTVVGTPAFMAPEQVRGRPTDHRTDVYALGTVLYRMVAGKNPFGAPLFDALAQKIAREPPPPLPDLTAAGEVIPPGLRSLIRECLQKEPGLRPHSMAEVALRLGRIVAQVPRPVSQRPAPTAVPAWRRAWAQVAGERWLRRPQRRAAKVSRKGWLPAAAALALVVPAAGVTLWRAAQAGPAVQAPPQAQAQPATALPAKVEVQVESEPAGATVVRADTGQRLGVTPLEVLLAPAEVELRLRLARDGYEPAELQVPTGSNASVKVVLRPR